MDCFFEIYSEEIPAKMQPEAKEQLKNFLEKFLIDIEHESIETFVTPQRLVAHITGLAAQTKEKVEMVRGPKITLPEDIVEKFCKSHGVTKDQLTQQDNYFYVSQTTPSKKADEVISQAIHTVLTTFHWPKTMRWPQAKIKWVRPIRSIMVVLDQKPLIFDVDIVGLKTTDHTTGHRFLSPQKIQPKTFAEYVKLLKENKVILNDLERQKIIEDNLQGAVPDKDLLIENAGLAEFPVVKKGAISDEFMKLPKAVLRTVMKVHQKYFFFEDAPHFAAVCNVLENSVIKGYERVLRARLSDARFFYLEDLKVPLKDHDLSRIVFYKGIGTIKDKISRMSNILRGSEEGKVLRLCKKDLMTQMVSEFPELHGIMGSIYAKAQKEKDVICEAIEDHLRLQPQTELGAKVALVDRLDSLVGLIGSGVKISGSKDPYGLRRHALTIIRIYEKFPDFEPLEVLISKVLKQYKTLPSDTAQIVEQFIYSRFKIYYQEDAAYVQVAISKYPLHQLRKASQDIKEFVHTKEGEEFLKGFKRLLGLVNVNKTTGEILPLHESEIFLNAKLSKALTFSDLKSIAPHLTKFFNEITVNEGAPHIVQSRQNLLFALKQSIEVLGDFSKIV
ncbi:MAG: glycine--tRNA ligase subunit beta [Alphaproteobacteria bacterium]|nr:MAG: glycine--tRNA ligase subunit beta [Alphaproteobacteria bacterium]